MRPAPSTAARPQVSAPSRSNAASAHPTPRIGTTIAPMPNPCHSAAPIARPQLPVNDTGNNVRPRKNPTSRAAMPTSSCRRSEEHTSELQSPDHLVCRLLLEKKKKKQTKLH